MKFQPSLIAALALALGLSGCQSKDEKNAISAASIKQAIAVATASADPWRAIDGLTAATHAALDANDGCDYGACQMAPSVLRFEETRWSLLETALDQARPEALTKVFGTNAIPNPPAIALNAEPHSFAPEKVAKWADSLLTLAGASSGADPTERDLIVTAGQILESGRYVQRDTYRATGLYARAWLAGYTPAAGAAARAYFGIGDMRNAYLWSIRCINDCDIESIAQRKGIPLRRDELQGLLSSQAAAQAQKAAGDRTVVELESGAPTVDPTVTQATRAAQ